MADNSNWMPENEWLGQFRIQAGAPDISAVETDLVSETLKSTYLSGRSPVVKTFEDEFAKLCGTTGAVACNSGGSALYLLLRGLGIGPGDEVIVPSFTMIATAGAVSLCGATPVFVDCETATLGLSAASVASAITPITKAIIIVHLYGHPARDTTDVVKLGADNNITVLEDAAEAHGAVYHGKVCGSLTRAAAFGFYANKVLVMGEGGCITSDDIDLLEKCRSFSDYCFTAGVHFWHRDIGCSMRMPALTAAVGLGQVRRADELLGDRRRVASFYDDCLTGYNKLYSTQLPDCLSCYWHYWVQVSDRRTVRGRLAAIGVETRPAFVPMHVQPAYRGGRWPSRSVDDLSNSETVAKSVLLLPTHGGVWRLDASDIITIIRSN